MIRRSGKKPECGQGLIEYILLLFFLTVAIVSTLLLLGGGASNLYREGINAFKRHTPTPDLQETPVLYAFKVQVVDNQAEGIAQVAVSIFDQDGNYLGDQIDTDEQGWTEFSELEPGAYSFRADHQQQQFWSEVVQVSKDKQTIINTEQDQLEVVAVDGNGVGITGVKVSAYQKTGAYVGVSETTTDNGTSLALVPGEYVIKAVYQGQTYTSAPVAFPEQVSVEIEIDIVSFVINVNNRQGNPEAGIPVLAFNPEGQYLGKSQQTDGSGAAEMELSPGDYRFRADYQAKAYWSPVMSVPPSRSTTIEVGPYRVAARVVDHRGEGIAGVPVHLFNEAGGYLGKTLPTDESGAASFNVYEGTYQFRADYAGQSHWSSTISVPRSQSAVISVGPRQFTVEVVTTGGEPVEGVYLLIYSLQGSSYRYLGWTRTSSEGKSSYYLSPGRYRVLVYPMSFYTYEWSPVFNPQVRDQITIRLPNR